MTDFKVSYTISGGGTTESEIRAYIEEDLAGRDLVIEEVKPKFEEGWYQYTGTFSGDREAVCFWSADELGHVAPEWGIRQTRMNPPTPYTEEKYKDGYYLAGRDNRDYKREIGKWFYRDRGDWIESAYSDDNIADYRTVTWVVSL